MFRSRFQDAIQKGAQNNPPVPFQSIIEYKLAVFLESVNEEENLLSPLLANGLCNGFAFMNFRADILGQENKNVTRFDTLMMLDEAEIEITGKLYKKYNEARTKLITAKEEEKSTPITKLNSEIDASYKQLTALRKNKVRDESAIKLLNDKIKSLRANREKLIDSELESDPNFKDHLKMINTAKELYLYIHSIAASVSPQHIFNLQMGEKSTTQQDFPEIMQLLTSEEEMKSSVEKVFQMSFCFTKQELIDLFENKEKKFDKNTLLEGDHIRINGGGHVIYVLLKTGSLFYTILYPF